MTKLIATALPGGYLIASRSVPGTFHVLQGVGTPFPTCSCEGWGNRQECWHTLFAVEHTATPDAKENLMPDPDTNTATADAPDVGDDAPSVALVPAANATRGLQMKAAVSRARIADQLQMWVDLVAIGHGMIQSRLLPRGVQTAEGAAMIMLKATALDIEISEAFDYIDVIDGRPAIRAQMMRALVARSGKGRIMVESADATQATVVGIRPGWGECRVTYTVEDAQAANLMSKDNWKNHPADMCVSRASTRVCRRLFADVLSGMDTVWQDAEGYEVDAIDGPEGGIVTERPLEGEYREVPATFAWQEEYVAEQKRTGATADEIAFVLKGRPKREVIHAWLQRPGNTVKALFAAVEKGRGEPMPPAPAPEAAPADTAPTPPADPPAPGAAPPPWEVEGAPVIEGEARDLDADFAAADTRAEAAPATLTERLNPPDGPDANGGSVAQDSWPFDVEG
ncbi:MAG: hypothetical protein ACSLE9_07845 [Burkholderiaceae bacterium]